MKPTLVRRIWNKPWVVKHRWKLGLTGVLVVASGLYFSRTAFKEKRQGTAYADVKRTDFLVSVVEGGTLKAVNEVTVRNEVEGVSRIISIVPEGTYVKKGDVLFELDSAELRERVASQEVTFQNAKFAVMQAREYLAIQKSMVESSIKDAELRVEFGISDLEKYKDGDWPQQQKNALSRITIAKVELERARERFDWTKRLNLKKYATLTELKADELTVQKNQIELDKAEEDLRLLQKFDYPKKLRLLEANLDQSKKELERIKARSSAQIAQVEADLNSKVTAMDLQETRWNQLKDQLKLTKVYAPEAGLVIYASSSSPGNGVLIEEGASVRQKQDIIKLPDVSQMMVEIRVHESHVQKIRPGLPAFISIDSVPDRSFRGTVRKVAVLPDSNSRYYNPNLKVYATEVLVDEPLPDLKPGISGRAEVIVSNLKNVLAVPLQAVTTIRGVQMCFVKQGDDRVPRPVEVGLFNEQLIEIKTGLKEGDQVLLSALGSGDSIDMSGSVRPDETKRGQENQPSNGATNGTHTALAPGSAISQSQTNLEMAPASSRGTNQFHFKPEIARKQ